MWATDLALYPDGTEGSADVGTAFATYTGLNVLIVLLAALLTLWAPSAGSSGLPKLKSYLNGTYMRDGMLSASTLVAKVALHTMATMATPPSGMHHFSTFTFTYHGYTYQGDRHHPHHQHQHAPRPRRPDGPYRCALAARATPTPTSTLAYAIVCLILIAHLTASPARPPARPSAHPPIRPWQARCAPRS